MTTPLLRTSLIVTIEVEFDSDHSRRLTAKDLVMATRGAATFVKTTLEALPETATGTRYVVSSVTTRAHMVNAGRLILEESS